MTHLGICRHSTYKLYRKTKQGRKLFYRINHLYISIKVTKNLKKFDKTSHFDSLGRFSVHHSFVYVIQISNETIEYLMRVERRKLSL